MRRTVRYAIGKFLLPRLLLLLSRTWRIEEEGGEEIPDILSGKEPAVIAFLHGRMIPVWYRFRGGNFGAVVSGSRDGELLTRFLERQLGYRYVLRGSSSRGGGEVLREMIALLEQRSCLITPDGPRGPSGEPKPGALIAALRSGRRGLTVNWSADRSWVLETWDQLEVPKPFSKIKFRYCIINLIQNISRTTSQKPPKTDNSLNLDSDTRISPKDLADFATTLRCRGDDPIV